MNRIFLIDGHAQIFRMYYAFMRRPMVNSKGVDTSILFGFTKMLLELLNKEHPTHLAVAFDPPAKTFRHEAYPQYKANRTAAPELVKAALEPLQEILQAFDIPVVMIPGYEADDVIGSMAKQWEGPDTQIYMVTPDKDYGQLISSGIFQYKPAKGGNETEIIGKKEICEHYGIGEPEQVIDILTIWGDSSDNIPGIRGIGEVGAKKLVGKYGSLREILRHTDELPEKQRTAIAESLEQIEMSRYLVTIKTDIELPVNASDLQLRRPDFTKIAEVFNKYEFESLKKMLPDYTEAPSSSDAAGTPDADLPEIRFVSLALILKQAKSGKTLALKMAGEKTLVLCTPAGEENEREVLTWMAEDIASVQGQERKDLQALLEDETIKKIAFNFKQYIKDLREAGFRTKGYIADVELMHYLLNPERSHRDDMLIKTYLDIDIHSLQYGSAQPEEQAAPPHDLFTAPDLFNGGSAEEEPDRDKLATECALLLPLYLRVEEDLQKAGQVQLYDTIEMPLIEVLADMEYCGVKIDTGHLKEYSRELTAQMNRIEQQVRDLAGEPSLNISSPKQIGTVLYEKLNISPKTKKNSRGSYPTDEQTLHELLDTHPIVNKILEYRGLKKLLSTYIDNFPTLICPRTGKIHTTFNQSLTATGRLSSNNPNLQNIPIRTEQGKEIRKAFIPSRPDGFIVSADYSQIELRLMAHLSNDKDMIEAFNSNEDVHAATAAKVFKVPQEQVSREQRSRAKVANFGIIYGISAFGLSQRLGMSRSDSKELIQEYFKTYPGVKEYMNKMIEKARKEGFVETIYGRKRFLPDINSRNAVVRNFSERNAINAPLQGSAADIIKVAMINIYNRMKAAGIESKMVLQVHDELVFDVAAPETEQVMEIVKQEMEGVIKLHVPLIAECNYGKNWLEAH